ncbi:MAG: PIN domain-containing protein [Coriobacteriia bacterium]|nr:PIN domain-containing protein [Coriobacteriia bacterium]
MRTVVLDTNVLLADPGALLSFPDAEVVIPETVLGEIDKLKTSRVDPDLRFRGREVSRMLFEFSEGGSLLDGIDLPDGGRLRVVPLEGDIPLPEGMATRNADDRILAVAYQTCSDGCEDLTLVTNDLNMLLKAQTFGIKVERRLELGAGLGKRTIRWFQRYKTPLTILAIAIAVFAGVLALSFYTSRLTGTAGNGAVPTEFRDLLTAEQRNLLDGLMTLERSPADLEAMKQVANAYYALRDQTGSVQFAQKGIEYYSRYLQVNPDDTDVRTDMAALLFYSGSTDRAIQEATAVIETRPDHIQANFNLGIFYWRGRTDYQAGARQFVSVIDLAAESTDPHNEIIATEARGNLQTLITEAEAAGVTVDIEPSYLPGGTI